MIVSLESLQMCPIVTFYYVYACIWLVALCFENPNRLKSLSNCADPNSKAGFILVFEMPEIRRTSLTLCSVVEIFPKRRHF